MADKPQELFFCQAALRPKVILESFAPNTNQNASTLTAPVWQKLLKVKGQVFFLSTNPAWRQKSRETWFVQVYSVVAGLGFFEATHDLNFLFV